MKRIGSTVDILVQAFGPSVFLSIKQVSQITGQAEQTLRNLISDENRNPNNNRHFVFPSLKIGGKRVVHIIDLANWLDEQRVFAPSLHEENEGTLDTSEIDAQHGSDFCRPSKNKRGRPTKIEERRFRGGRQ